MQKSIKFRHGFILISAAIIVLLVFQFVAADTQETTATNGSLPNFIGPTNITSAGLKNATNPVVSSSPNGSNVLVAYKLQTDTDHDIYFRKSTDNGSNWTSANPIVTTTGVNSSQVDIDHDSSSNRAHAIWVENNNSIYHARELANGGWQITLTDVERSSPAIVSDPRVFASSNYLDVVWVQQNGFADNPDIYHTRSTTLSAWPASTNFIINDGAVIPALPDLFVDGNTIHVVWEEQRLLDASERHIVYVVGTWNSLTKKATWSDKVDLSHVDNSDDKFAIAPRITINNNVIHVTYTEQNLEADEPKDEQYIYHASCSLLTDDCKQRNDWDFDGQISKRLGANTGSPGFIQSTVAGLNNCLLTYYHGVEFDPIDPNNDDNNELIWGNFNCPGRPWTTNNEKALLDINDQLIRPDINIRNSAFIFLVYEKDDANGISQIQFMRTQPIVYLPVISK